MYMYNNLKIPERRPMPEENKRKWLINPDLEKRSIKLRERLFEIINDYGVPLKVITQEVNISHRTLIWFLNNEVKTKIPTVRALEAFANKFDKELDETK